VSKAKNAHEEYKEQIEQAQKDTKTVIDSTEEMIDMPFFEYAKFLEGKNIGELNAFRALLQMHIDKADIYGKTLVENKVSVFGKEERIVLGSVFAVTAKIQDRMGYIDYLIQKNSVKFN
jgi:hypothetical protein